MTQGLQAKLVASLVPSNPKVQAIAQRFRWSPEALIKRIQSALPAIVEQQIYLQVAKDLRMQPESLAKILRAYLGTQELQVADLEDYVVGENLIANRITDVADFLAGVFNLVNKVDSDFHEFGISMQDAAQLVIQYGADGAEAAIDHIDKNWEAIGQHLGFNQRHMKYPRVMGTAIAFLVNEAIPDLEKRGLPAPLGLLAYFESDKNLVREAFRQATGGQ